MAAYYISLLLRGGWSSSAMAVGFAICILVLSNASTCGVAAARQMEEIPSRMPRSLLANELAPTPPMGYLFPFFLFSMLTILLLVW